MASHQPKSRFRGVYRCGKRWKAQLQSQGVQFYLGTFDSEEEAAKAYDKKARDEKGEKSQTNFDDFGSETGVCQLRYHQQDFNTSFDNNCFLTSDFGSLLHRQQISLYPPPQQADKPSGPLEAENKEIMNNNLYLLRTNKNSESFGGIRGMWERLSQLSQRQLLAAAARDKLVQLLHASPGDEEQQSLVQELTEEVFLLGLVKAQLEEAITSAMTVICNDASPPSFLLGSHSTTASSIAAPSVQSEAATTKPSFHLDAIFRPPYAESNPAGYPWMAAPAIGGDHYRQAAYPSSSSYAREAFSIMLQGGNLPS